MHTYMLQTLGVAHMIHTALHMAWYKFEAKLADSPRTVQKKASVARNKPQSQARSLLLHPRINQRSRIRTKISLRNRSLRHHIEAYWAIAVHNPPKLPQEQESNRYGGELTNGTHASRSSSAISAQEHSRSKILLRGERTTPKPKPSAKIPRPSSKGGA